MTRADYDPSTGTILADLAPDTHPAVVHAGREGRSVVLHMSHLEAVHLRDQLRAGDPPGRTHKTGAALPGLTGFAGLAEGHARPMVGANDISRGLTTPLRAPVASRVALG